MIEQRTEADMLFDTIKEWAGHQNNWRVTLESRECDALQSSEVIGTSELRLHTPQGRIHFEPLGRDKDGNYIVEMYAWPTLVRVFLRHKHGRGWQTFTDSGLPFHAQWNEVEWNEANFVRLVSDLQVLP